LRVGSRAWSRFEKYGCALDAVRGFFRKETAAIRNGRAAGKGGKEQTSGVKEKRQWMESAPGFDFVWRDRAKGRRAAARRRWPRLRVVGDRWVVFAERGGHEAA